MSKTNLSVAQKIVTILTIILSILVIVLSILQLTGVWKAAINVCIPILGVVNCCQAFMQWNSSRKTAYFCLITAAFIFLCAISILVMYLLR